MDIMAKTINTNEKKYFFILLLLPKRYEDQKLRQSPIELRETIFSSEALYCDMNINTFAAPKLAA